MFMGASGISNNFIFIFFIIVKNYRKVKRPETEVAESIRRFIYSEIDTLHYFEWSKITSICVTDSIRAVWTQSPYCSDAIRNTNRSLSAATASIHKVWTWSKVCTSELCE